MYRHHRSAACGCACLAALACTGPTFAQSYPEKPIRFIVPFAPGGTTDYLSRTYGQKAAETWKQAVVIDSRPGAGGTLGAHLGAKAPPDGYTIVLTAISHAAAVGFYRTLPYDLTTDLQAVSLFATQPNALAIHPSLPARTVKELIALARAKPGELAFSSAGNGSIQHLMGELFASLAKIRLIHVPYKGTSPALTDLIAGQVVLSFQPMISVVPAAKSGRVRALAVTGSKRSSAAPELPTMIEAGLPGYDVVAWYGLHAPAGTPKAIVDVLAREANRVFSAPDVRERLVALGLEPAANTPEQFTAFVKSEVARWVKVSRDAGVRPE